MLTGSVLVTSKSVPTVVTHTLFVIAINATAAGWFGEPWPAGMVPLHPRQSRVGGVRERIAPLGGGEQSSASDGDSGVRLGAMLSFL